MSFDPKTCKLVMWGFKNTYHTNSHILEGFYRAAKALGRESYWLDHKSDLAGIDFSNSLFITEHQAVLPGTPVRDDCFYLCHNLYGGSPVANELLKNANKAHFGVYTLHYYNDHGRMVLLDNGHMPVYPEKRVMDILWATDLLPHEIEANKAKAVTWNPDSAVINWIGSGRRTLDPFANACKQNFVKFNLHSSWDGHIVTVEDNVRLIQESRFAPTLVDDYQLTHPYIPCRIFKNISYGHFALSNSGYVNNFLEANGRACVYHHDAFQLFGEAQRWLQNQSLSELHRAMDWVAAQHTYVNRTQEVLKAVELWA